MSSQAVESMTFGLVLVIGAVLGLVVHLLLNEDRGTMKVTVLLGAVGALIGMVLGAPFGVRGDDEALRLFGAVLGAGSLLWLHQILVYGPRLEAERLRGLRREKGPEADPTESSRYPLERRGRGNPGRAAMRQPPISTERGG